jgi:hypothetical protein
VNALAFVVAFLFKDVLGGVDGKDVIAFFGDRHRQGGQHIVGRIHVQRLVDGGHHQDGTRRGGSQGALVFFGRLGDAPGQQRGGQRAKR